MQGREPVEPQLEPDETVNDIGYAPIVGAIRPYVLITNRRVIRTRYLPEKLSSSIDAVANEDRPAIRPGLYPLTRAWTMVSGTTIETEGIPTSLANAIVAWQETGYRIHRIAVGPADNWVILGYDRFACECPEALRLKLQELSTGGLYPTSVVFGRSSGDWVVLAASSWDSEYPQ